ncbi:MAG: hypothetical protein H6767_06840 [Candidatus Peribacteria bacterium]|nr:MAG: hypothetical protein H6767_06840 [Candidatus Peribacteria bacterium]
MQTGGNITTNIVTIFDQYDNPVTGQYFTLKLSLDDDILSFKENNSQELELTTFEGYRAFQLQSGNDTGELEFSAELIENGRTLLTQTLPIEVLQSIQVDLEIPTNMQVGYRNYTLPITLKDASGNILSDLSSRVYFGLNSLYGKTTSPYFDITNGRGEIQFQTANVALQSIPVTLQIEGFSASISRQISILPETALYLDMSLSKSKIEASPTDTSYVTIELKDRYGNKVYTDNTTQLTFTIPEAYRDILTVERAVQTVSG